MTFEKIYTDAMKDCHKDPNMDTALLVLVKSWINRRYRKVWTVLSGADPTFGRAKSTLITTAQYTTGSVNVINGSTTVTGISTVWTSAMIGRKLQLGSWTEVYEISTRVSDTEITLSKAINAETDDALSYVIYQDEIDLPDDCGEVVSIGQYMTPAQLNKIGISEMRRRQLASPYSTDSIQVSDPVYWSYLTNSRIIVHPAPYRQIVMPIDYTVAITDLEDDDDEPLIIDDYCDLLIIGAKAEIKKYEDDYDGALAENQEFEKGLYLLILKSARKTDRPSIRPKVYRQ